MAGTSTASSLDNGTFSADALTGAAHVAATQNDRVGEGEILTSNTAVKDTSSDKS
jgi:hypothetical protein